MKNAYKDNLYSYRKEESPIDSDATLNRLKRKHYLTPVLRVS